MPFASVLFQLSPALSLQSSLLQLGGPIAGGDRVPLKEPGLEGRLACAVGCLIVQVADLADDMRRQGHAAIREFGLFRRDTP